MGEKRKNKDPIVEVLPWTKPDFLVEAINEKKKEKLEVIELVESLVSDELPEEVKSIVKKPKKEELIKDDEDDIPF
ncbi:MAG: hypothetical protein J7L37_01870 [Thermococcus sp.]|nr:hypothetical protein [Thermococcus sp.]